MEAMEAILDTHLPLALEKEDNFCHMDMHDEELIAAA